MLQQQSQPSRQTSSDMRGADFDTGTGIVIGITLQGFNDLPYLILKDWHPYRHVDPGGRSYRNICSVSVACYFDFPRPSCIACGHLRWALGGAPRHLG